ncbi:uncharacterized protein Dana_GF28167 [Drosophila ananassae]|uniref:Uncharacterized protein n=1 Tax=Drosophila ananassae TaxID=7217 RepID=A0A0P8XF22_DROAN|nr:uncharacterized protein Dana_GF28167 [Drosophila ananassae]
MTTLNSNFHRFLGVGEFAQVHSQSQSHKGISDDVTVSWQRQRLEGAVEPRGWKEYVQWKLKPEILRFRLRMLAIKIELN